MIEKDIRKLLDLVEEKSVTSTKQLNESKASPQDMVEGMPSSVAKHKQQLADMSDKEFAEKYGSKSDEELMAMAWRNGYGKDSKFYVNKKNKGKQGVAEGYSLKKTNVEKYMKPGDPDEYTQDINIKDTDYEIINNKTGQVVGTASWTTNDYFGPGALKITMKNGATRWLDIWEREKGNPQTAFNRFVKDPKTAKKYKEQGVAEGTLKESSIKFGIKQALKEGYWDDIGKAVLDFKGSELPRNYRKLEINSDSPHYKLHADEFKKDVWDQLKDKGVAVAKQIAPAKKVGGVSLTPELLLQIWRKLENVVSNVVPDGDPIDWMAPYLRKMGVDPFYTREILDKAVKRHYDKRSDYSKYLQDMWDAYGEMQGDDYQNPWK